MKQRKNNLKKTSSYTEITTIERTSNNGRKRSNKLRYRSNSAGITAKNPAVLSER